MLPSRVNQSLSVVPDLFRFFDDVFTRDRYNTGLNTYWAPNVPAVNVQETDEAYRVEVAAPGISRDCFNIEVENDMLRISCEQQNETEEKDGQDNGKWLRREFSYRTFERKFHIDSKVVNADAIEANYRDGILRVVLPKREEVKPRPPRRIEIA